MTAGSIGPSRNLLQWGRTAWATLGIVLLAVAAFLGLGKISGLVVPLLVALVVGALFVPLCAWLARWMPRPLASVAVLLGLLAVAAGTLTLAVRGLLREAGQIAHQLTVGYQTVRTWAAEIEVRIPRADAATDNLTEVSGTVLSGIGSQLGNVFSGTATLAMGTFVGIFLLYFVLADWDLLMRWTSRHLGVAPEVGAGILQDGIWAMRQYFLALTVSSIVVSVLVGLTAWLLDLPLALTIALITFITSYVPFLGAIVSGAFATLIALGSGGMLDAVVMLAVILVAQNVVQTIIQTFMTQGALKLHPIVILGSTIAGGALFGLLGAALSTPVVAILVKVVERFRALGDGPGPGPGPEPGHDPPPSPDVHPTGDPRGSTPIP